MQCGLAGGKEGTSLRSPETRGLADLGFRSHHWKLKFPGGQFLGCQYPRAMGTLGPKLHMLSSQETLIPRVRPRRTEQRALPSLANFSPCQVEASPSTCWLRTLLDSESSDFQTRRPEAASSAATGTCHPSQVISSGKPGKIDKYSLSNRKSFEISRECPDGFPQELPSRPAASSLTTSISPPKPPGDLQLLSNTGGSQQAGPAQRNGSIDGALWSPPGQGGTSAGLEVSL